MAVITNRIDDINGEADATTVVITVNGQGVEIDLAAKSAERLTRALEPFWRVGTEATYDVVRKATQRNWTKKTNGHGPVNVDPAVVRQWANDNGIDVGLKGRIPRDIVEQFRRARDVPE